MTDTELRVRDMLAESGIEGEGCEEIVERLVSLERYVDDAPPEPSPELAALMAGMARTVVTAPFARRRSRMLIAGAVAFGTVAAGGIAAAANELPPAAQSLVAELSERYLPFVLPHPDARRAPQQDEPGSTPATEGTDPEPGAGTPGTTPGGAPSATETADPTPQPSTSASPAPSGLPTPGTAEPTPSAGPTGIPEPSLAPSPGTDGATTDPQAGESVVPSPSAGESTGSEAGPEASDPAEPSAGTSPSPTANTRTEGDKEPSTAPSTSPSAGSDPSPSGTSTAVWGAG